MFAVEHYIAGIVLANIAWIGFYLTGWLVRTPVLIANTRAASQRPSSAVLEVAVRTATGMAIVGLATFVLGMLGWLYPVSAAAGIVVILAAFHVLGDTPLRPEFWRAKFAVVRDAATWSTAVLYVLCLVLAVPAVLPETAFDALFFHLLYALDWSSAHRIYVDEWLRWPYYASNWVLLDSWTFELGLGSYVDFLGWLGGTVSLFCVYGLVDALADSLRSTRVQRQIAALLAACCALFSPIFIRWVDSGMVDAAIGLFYTASVAAVVMAVATRERRWAYDAILCFAFFVGMKSVFVGFIPAAVAGVWIAMRRSGATPRGAVAAAGMLLALALPWYVKNTIAVGDPSPPILHLALHQQWQNWTPADLAGIAADLNVDTSPLFLLALPVDIILNTGTRNYRELGVSLLVALIFTPCITLAYGLLRRGRFVLSPWFALCAFLCYAIAFWLLTSHLGRYALLFYPGLAAFVGIGALQLARGPRWRQAGVLAALAICALPNPAGASFLAYAWQTSYVHLSDVYPSRASFLNLEMPDYPEEEYVSRRLLRAKIPQPRVYMLGDETLDFYFKLHGVTRIGDWFSNQRYADFAAAIDAGTAPQYLHGLKIDAFIMSPHAFLTPVRVSRLTRELAAAGYERKVLPGRTDAMFFAPWAVW